MRTYSITTRLTITCAALTAVVLAPTALALYLTVASVYTTESIEKANDRARVVSAFLLGQIADDFMIDFEGQPIDFAGFRPKVVDWAVIRADGGVEHVAGAFAAGIAPGIDPAERIIKASDGRPLRVASAQLIRDRIPSIEELPPQIRRTAEAILPEAVFLCAIRETTRDRNIIEVKKLGPNYVAEIEIAEDGTKLRSGREYLPDEFEPNFLAYLPQETRPVADLRFSWRAHLGHVLAVIEGTSARGIPVRHAMNRLGELFLFDADGNIVGPDPSSRIFAVAAIDVTREIEQKRTLLFALLLGAPCVWLGLVLVGAFVARRAMSPVKGIVESTRRVHLSNTGERVPVGHADDELAWIATTINDMLDRIEKGYRRERQFTGDASHELRGPLTKIQADAELAISRERNPEEYRDALSRIAGYARNMKGLVESLLLLARMDGGTEELKKERFDLTELLVETIGTLPRSESRRVNLEVGAAASPIQAFGQRSLIGTAIHNLVENALRYSPAGDPVKIRIQPNGTCVLVEIEDHGPGIAPELRDRVFNRFFRADAARTRDTGGAGLGLAIVRAIAKAHGTSVELRDAPAGGTIAAFTVSAAN